MEDRLKDQTQVFSPNSEIQTDNTAKSPLLQLGIYAHKGRVAVIDNNSPLLENLNLDPANSEQGRVTYEIFSWLIDKPRRVEDSTQSYIVSTLPQSQFSGFQFHPKQGIFVESFDSPHEWRQGEHRGQDQIADLLLPGGQWHRHYSVVVLSESANDKQVELVRHWLELTGGSLLIIKHKQNSISPSIQALIDELTPVQQTAEAESFFENYHAEQVITLPPSTINSLKLTDNLRENSQYFSIKITDLNNNETLSLHDIPINETSSWQAIAHSIETHVNKIREEHSLPTIQIRYENNTLRFLGENIIFRQFQLKQAKQTLTRGSKQQNVIDQILPILVTENPDEIANQLVAGAITGKLPASPQVNYYQIIEQPKFGLLTLNNETHEWQYIADQAQFDTHADQFDFVAVMHNGQHSQPISIQLQTEKPPLLSLPGKRTFSIPDPIYSPPPRKYHPTPKDMQVNRIQLGQTHLQKMTDKHMSLTANRWALLSMDITSESAAKSPNIEAIVSNKQRKIVGRVRLTGPDQLPKTLTELPDQPNVTAQDWHQQRFTAPLKGEWIQPDINIVIAVNGKAIINEETDQYGMFSPNVSLDNHLIVQVNSHSLYQQGHGIHPYSPLSWGQEAVAILPIGQLTVYSPPSSTHQPSLVPYQKNAGDLQPPFIHPLYDNLKKDESSPRAQMNWAYNNSRQFKTAFDASPNSDYHYTAIETFILGKNTTLLGLASPHFGGGEHTPNVMFHELFGHGLGLPHTNTEDHNKKPLYPYDPHEHGKNPAYNQSRQYYITYNERLLKRATATMYPYFKAFISDFYDAFLPHADVYNQKIHQFLSQKARWQPNKIKGKDIEDGGFAGEGFYQRWDESTKQWVTLNQHNYSDYYHVAEIDQFPHQRDIPIYWIRNQSAKMADNTDHPYSTTTVDRTLGNLPADYHNLKTGTGRQYCWYHHYALTVTYATSNGLLTERLQIPQPNSLSIADKGELVQFTIHELNGEKELGRQIHHYQNPNALANRLLANSDGHTLPTQLVFDNYWQGAPIFWAATEPDIIDFSTGEMNSNKITATSALCAKWVENGRLHQQYFSLSDPFGQDLQVNTAEKFVALNHLDTHIAYNPSETNIHHEVADQRLIADMNIEQQVDVTSLNLPNGQYAFWVTLMTSDEQKHIQEKVPTEEWYFSIQQNQLTVKGTIDSTPGLQLDGILIHIDQHLQDNAKPRLVWLYQNPAEQLAENPKFLDDNQPVVFNSGATLTELISTMPETEPSRLSSMAPSIPPQQKTHIPLSV